ncbi:MAG: hypothetical protein ACC630_02430 [Nitrospinota bacterium]
MENGGYRKIKKFDTDRDYILGWERVSQPKGERKNHEATKEAFSD